MKSFFVFLLILFSCPLVFAQQMQKKGCKCSFQSLNQVGLLEGETGSAFQLQSINGVQYKTWFAGVGTGIDYYRFRSVPLFLDIRKDLLKKNFTPFVYSDIGVHFPWKREGELHYGDAKFATGLYYDMGLGLNFATSKNQGFSLRAGYSYKRIKETSTWSMQCFTYPCYEFRQTRSYGLNRLSMKLGWVFKMK